MLWTSLIRATGAGRPEFIGVSQTNSTASNTTSLTVNVPTGVQNGDLLIAVLFANDTVADFAQTGFTWALEHSARPSLGVAYRVASNEPSSYTFTTTGSRRLGGQIIAFRGGAWDTIGAIATGNTYTANSITAAASDSVLIGAFAADVISRTWGAPSGMTVVSEWEGGNRPVFATYRQDIEAGTTGTRQATLSGALTDQAAAVLFSIKPA